MVSLLLFIWNIHKIWHQLLKWDLEGQYIRWTCVSFVLGATNTGTGSVRSASGFAHAQQDIDSGIENNNRVSSRVSNVSNNSSTFTAPAHFAAPAFAHSSAQAHAGNAHAQNVKMWSSFKKQVRR